MVIDFGTNVTNCSVIFDVNGNYGIGNNSMWIHGNNWNGHVAFPNGIDYSRMSRSGKVNKSVQIPNSVTNTFSMFNSCTNFNQNIQIPNSVINASTMFGNCTSLNQNIQIPNSVINAQYMFGICNNLNQNIQIPNGVKNVAYMFNGCRYLNYNIQIPNSVTNAAGMFNGCYNLNQNIQIPSGVTNAAFMFSLCDNLSGFSIQSGKANNVFMGALRENNSQMLNIYTESTTAANLITTNLVRNGTKIGVANCIRPTWETVSNGYYNALYNIRIYNNTVFA